MKLILYSDLSLWLTPLSLSSEQVPGFFPAVERRCPGFAILDCRRHPWLSDLVKEHIIRARISSLTISSNICVRLSLWLTIPKNNTISTKTIKHLGHKDDFAVFVTMSCYCIFISFLFNILIDSSVIINADLHFPYLFYPTWWVIVFNEWPWWYSGARSP